MTISEIKCIIEKAIEQNLDLEIEYEKYSGEYSKRRLSNVEYTDEHERTYISAFCHIRNEMRTFKIHRIKSAVLLSNNGDNSMQAVELQPLDIENNYQFNPKKKIFKLYGKDYN